MPAATGHSPACAPSAPRPAIRGASIEERCGTHEGYVCVVRRAVERAVEERFLLRSDADRLIAEADTRAVLPAGSGSAVESRVIAARVCAAAAPR